MFRSVHNKSLYNLVVQHLKFKKIIEVIQNNPSQLRIIMISFLVMEAYIKMMLFISSNLIQGSWNVAKYNELMNQRFNLRAIISITETLQ